VFVASDKTEDAFNDYCKQHPWSIIDYEDTIRTQLREMYNIKTIPALVFLDSQGNIIEANGRVIIDNALEEGYDTEHAAQTIAIALNVYESNYNSDDSDF